MISKVVLVSSLMKLYKYLCTHSEPQCMLAITKQQTTKFMIEILHPHRCHSTSASCFISLHLTSALLHSSRFIMFAHFPGCQSLGIFSIINCTRVHYFQFSMQEEGEFISHFEGMLRLYANNNNNNLQHPLCEMRNVLIPSEHCRMHER